MKRRLSPFLIPRLILAVLLLLLLIVRVGGSLAPDTSLQRVQQAGVLVVALDASYPPFETTDGLGDFSGFDVELSRAIAKRLGVGVRFANISFDSLYDALAAGKADVIISGMRYEAERTRDVIYSASYFDAGQTLIVRAGDGIGRAADLAGRSVGVETASEADVEAQKLARKTAGMAVKQYETPEAALAALLSGALAAVATDRVTALTLVKGQAGLRLLPPFAADPLLIAGDIQDRRLMNEIGRILKQLQDDGTLARLADESF